jgi:hypothetical protein
MSVSLPLKVRIAPNESLGGFAHRLAARNRAAGYWLWRKLGTKRSLTSQHTLLLSEYAGLAQSILDEHCWHTSGEVKGGSYTWMADSKEIECQTSRVCLDCIKEEVPHLKLFELHSVRYCPTHLKLLTDFCPVCARRLHWRRQDFSKCAGGHDLKRCKARPCQPTETERNFVSTLLALSDPKQSKHVRATLPEAIRSLSFWEVLYVCRLILGIIERSGAAKPRSLLSHPSSEDMAVAFTRLSDWPAALFPDLERLRNSKERHFALFNTRTRNWLTGVMAGSRSPNAVRLLHAAIDEVHGHAAGWNVKLSGLEGTHISVAEACRRTRQTRATVLAFAATRRYHVVESGATWVPEKLVDALLREAAHRVPGKDVAKLLGITRTEVKPLAQLGLFGATTARRAKAHGTHFYVLNQQIDELLSVIRRSMTGAKCKNPWILHRCHHQHFLAGLTHGDLIAAVFHGRLRPAHWNEPDLESMVFELEDLRRFAETHNPKPRERDLLTLRQAAKEFGCSKDTFAEAIRCKLLTIARKERDGFLIDRKSIRTFSKQFTTSRWVAKKTGLSPQTVSGQLGRRKIRPVGRVGGIYRLNEVVAAGLGVSASRAREAAAEAIRLIGFNERNSTESP